MRQSRYTVSAMAADGSHLLYNTATGAFAQLDDAAFVGYCASGGQWETDLAAAGFITDLSAPEELAAQRAQFDAARADGSTLTLSFVPTYACNYRCPYCYELGHNQVKGKMDGRMMDAICAFVEGRFAANGFKRMSVQWYGGDPSLALDVVEALSSRLISWCDEHDVSYDSFMLSNANLIDDAAAQIIAEARIGSVMLTIDGPEEVHNRRRVAADGSNSYQRNLEAARHLRNHGVSVAANMNADKVSWQLYPALRDQLRDEEGIVLTASKLCDYGRTYGTAPFAAPDFELFTHEEFAQAGLELFQAEPHDAAEVQRRLSPASQFCNGQSNNYFVIDLLGDVYNCDGWVGDTSHVRFNLFDDPSTWKLEDVSHDATRDEKCSECELLPVCQGSCNWERACNGWPCHPLKTTMEGYLRVWRDSLDVVGDGAGYMRLA